MATPAYPTDGALNVSVTINRDEIEYKQGTPCPIDYVEPNPPRAALVERLSQGYKVCKKGNIASKCCQSPGSRMETQS